MNKDPKRRMCIHLPQNHQARSIENIIIGTTSEKPAQGRYPSTIGGPRSPTSHQEKEAWMGRTHNAKKRWQMDEACARMVSHRREAARWKTTDDGEHLKTHWSTIANDRMAWNAVIRDHIRGSKNGSTK
uniref:Uncharacterized protein n=2 Tax=Caenorhabditis japonica TaxID=281687 RepID=A0A8R1I7V2_CAEJA